jgi:TonB family protein
MIDLSSSNALLRFAKFTFLFLIGTMLCNLATPIAAAQSSPPQSSQSQSSQSQTSLSQSSGRKVKSSAPPEYPELARKLNIQGMARVLLTVTADGKVANVKDLGGNPILVAALVDAVKKWKYEPADRESAVEVRFEFIQNH